MKKKTSSLNDDPAFRRHLEKIEREKADFFKDIADQRRKEAEKWARLGCGR